MRIEQQISPAMVPPLKLISAYETEWNRIAHLSQFSTARSSTYRKNVKDLFAFQEVKSNFLL
jgi:hypothetical protein